MQSVQHKSFNLAAVLIVALLCVPVVLAPAPYVPWVLAGIGLLAAGVLFVQAEAVLALLLAWLATASVFGYDFWVADIPGFFNLTIDRIALGGCVVLFAIGLFMGRIRLYWPPVLGVVLVALVAWCAISAQVGGWTVAIERIAGARVAPPYYRFFAGFLFPAIVFFMAASVIRRENQIRSVLLFFSLFGVYLTVVGLAQKFEVDWLVWPKYILNPELGIHQERVRGPFLNAPDMGLTLVICLFANLLLAAKSRIVPRVALVLISLPMPVVIFWTLTRSIWLAFIACLFLAIWVWPRARATRIALTLTTAAALAIFTFAMWDRLSSENRERGGVAERAPVISRIELAKVSVDLAGKHPLTGVGLGRFQVAAGESPRMREMGSQAAIFAPGAVEHNNFLSMLAETGIPGALIYAALIFALLAVSIRLYRVLPATALGFLDRRFIGFYWIVWLAFFIDSMFRLTTFSPFPNGMFLLLGGVMVGYHHLLGPQPIGLPASSPAGAGP